LGFVVRHGAVGEVQTRVAVSFSGEGVRDDGEDWVVGRDWATDKLSIPPDSILYKIN
jgi:hypothetical protein